MEFPFVSRKKYDELAYKLECLLCHATGSKLSKHTYDLRTMESAVTDYINDTYDEGYEEGRKSMEDVTEITEILDRLDRCINSQCIEIKDERGIKGYVPDGVHTIIAEFKKRYGATDINIGRSAEGE